jgi:hypothetical protein
VKASIPLCPSHKAGVSRLAFSSKTQPLPRRVLSRIYFPQLPMPDLLSLTSGLPSGAIAWCLYECSQMFVILLLVIFFQFSVVTSVYRGIMSVAISIAPVLFKHSDVVLRAGWSSSDLWTFIVTTGTIFGAVFSPIIGAAVDQTKSALSPSRRS